MSEAKSAAHLLGRNLIRVMWIQGAVAVVAAVAAAVIVAEPLAGASAALFGGGLALASSWLMARRVAATAGRTPSENEIRLALYGGAVQRFVLVLAGFAAGMGLLKLLPLPMLATFAVAQIAFAIGNR